MALEPIQVGSVTLDPVLVLLGLFGVAALALLVLVVIVAVHMSRRRREARESDAQLAELKGRLQTLAEISVSRHGELARAVNERLDRMTHRVGSDLTETARKTTNSIAKLHERLAVIDSAQKNLTELSTNMVSLQEILANKQARGAFGQMRMEAIIQDGLPKGAFTFQATLSNGKRPDCLLAYAEYQGRRGDRRQVSAGRLRGVPRRARDRRRRKRRRGACASMSARHVDAMAERYFLPGETQDTAILFVPSEAIYADLAEHFSDLVQKAHRARIVICAPNMLMLAVQTMQAILKDVKMREQAHLIQREVTQADGGHGAVARARARSAAAFRPGQRRHREDPHIIGADRFARPQDRELGVRGRRGKRCKRRRKRPRDVARRSFAKDRRREATRHSDAPAGPACREPARRGVVL